MSNRKSDNDLGSWIFPIIMLCVFPPVGVFLLVMKLFGLMGSISRSSGQVKKHPYDLSREDGEQWSEPAAASAPKKQKKAAKTNQKAKNLIPDGKGWILGGGIATGICTAGALSILGDCLYWLPTDFTWFVQSLFSDLIPMLCFLAASVGVLLYGLRQKKKGSRFRKYLSLIGKRSQVNLDTMSEVGGISKKTLCDDLQEMLDKGILPTGYLDLLADRLVLSDEGVPERMAAPEPVKDDKPADLSREDAILAEIRQLNDDIAQPELSRQIDEIEEITRKIFQQLKSNPAKEPQLRSFLNYYLPTTLKILHAYAQLESQGIEGDNITAAKARIEGMMDKVVEGFEKQLDKLFEHDAMDITTDVEVLEKMLSKDGLSGGQGMQLGL